MSRSYATTLDDGRTAPFSGSSMHTAYTSRFGFVVQLVLQPVCVYQLSIFLRGCEVKRDYLNMSLPDLHALKHQAQACTLIIVQEIESFVIYG